MKNRGLGRGLDALLSNEGDNVSSKIETTNVMPLSQLTPGKFQPRKNFNQDSLKELAESIKAQGIIQVAETEAKEIVASEIAQARKDAASLIDKTNRDLEAQKNLALEKLETQVDELSDLIKEKLLGKEVIL